MKTIKRDSQNARILLHLAQGKKLTRYKAMLMFRVQNITARMTELRKVIRTMPDALGFEHGAYIQVTTKVDPNGQSFAEYKMPARCCRQAVGAYLQKLRRPRRAA